MSAKALLLAKQNISPKFFFLKLKNVNFNLLLFKVSIVIWNPLKTAPDHPREVSLCVQFVKALCWSIPLYCDMSKVNKWNLYIVATLTWNFVPPLSHFVLEYKIGFSFHFTFGHITPKSNIWHSANFKRSPCSSVMLILHLSTKRYLKRQSVLGFTFRH